MRLRFHHALLGLVGASQLFPGCAFSELLLYRSRSSLRVASADDVEDLSDGYTDGAELTPEMKAKIKESHTSEEEASQGGQMFRKMMERAQQGGGMNHRPRPPPPTVPFPNASMQATNFNNMSVEEQARMFREMMQRQQQGGYAPQPTYQPPPPTPNYLGAGVAPDGRRIGRNRDADAIVNSADLYFAQLKRDSSVRNMARYSGDEEYANQVFADPSIKEISMHVNPYMEQAKKEKDLVETSMDEMILPYMLVEEEKQDPTSAGVRYKDLLKTKRKRASSEPTNNRDSPNSNSRAATSEQAEISVFTRSVNSPTTSADEPKAATSEREFSVSDNINSLILAIDGAIKVYHNVDISARSVALVSVKEFLSHLVALAVQNGATKQAKVPVLEEESLINTLEALVLTFKNIQPEVRLTILLSSQVLMQSALVSCEFRLGSVAQLT
ncbi:hypothetical protein FisN_2Lh257 [Fistulifera solaris]|uniref:Uncharacterized protein n=1 Tax=Fistulifera solaris TaxID=1519565 RepID=A0A1Z5KG85_FISSO|nr:hypothetical protein FisN_2Lh257 [Fistulifera solaris]|eukprot:GAX24978.1 hypothetical protein FisN_2Lh257 [Fistulifera solaris]